MQELGSGSPLVGYGQPSHHNKSHFTSNKATGDSITKTTLAQNSSSYHNASKASPAGPDRHQRSVQALARSGSRHQISQATNESCSSMDTYNRETLNRENAQNVTAVPASAAQASYSGAFRPSRPSHQQSASAVAGANDPFDVYGAGAHQDRSAATKTRGQSSGEM